MSEIEVSCTDVMGDDLTVVNAARVSFEKRHDQFEEHDENLLRYLAEHGHWSPFAHPQIQFQVKAPLFVLRQLQKHQVGLHGAEYDIPAWNEVSRRYVDSEPEFFKPAAWRKRAADKKQGSLDDVVPGVLVYDIAVEQALAAYKGMLKAGVCPEQARMVLPQSMMTEWYWTGSLYAFYRVCKDRLSDDAQRETGKVAAVISERCENYFPVSWRVLRQAEYPLIYTNSVLREAA